ncbi:MAG TPA: MMPL family transporter [Candidatus Dormibacteraeota bacterium]
MTFLGRVSRFVIAHRYAVAAFWLVVTFVGVATVSTTISRLTTEFSVPGKEGPETSGKIAALFGIGSVVDPVVAVVQLPPGTTVDTAGVMQQLQAFDAQILQTDASRTGQPTVKVVSYASTCAAGRCDRSLVSADGRTTYAVVTVPNPAGSSSAFDVPQQEKDLRPLVNNASIAGGTARLTGIDELTSNPTSDQGPSLLVETLVAGAGALAILAFVFASFIAFVPLVVAIVSIMTSFLLILGLTAVIDVSFIVQFLVGLIGLGVAIDYSLLVVTRWREERARGLDNDEAIHTAMEHAGRAVLFSGTTVGIGLLALVVLPVPFLRSIGFAGLLIPVVSVAVAITLLPVILHSVGNPAVRWPWRYPMSAVYPALFIPRFLRRLATYPDIRKEAHVSRGWAAWGRLVVRRRWIAAAAALAIVGVLIVPATRLTLGTPVPDSLASSGPAHDGLRMLETSGLGTAGFEPNWILVSGDGHRAPGGASVASVVHAAAALPGMATALAPQGPGWSAPPGVPASLVIALSNLNPDSSQGRTQIHDLRSVVHEAAGGAGATAALGGSPAGSSDFVDAVYGSFPLMLGLVLVITFVLLARAFRSLLLSLKAVLLNVASVLAAYGIMVFVWQEGHGSSQLFGINATGAVAEWIPIFVFAFLFGLSMDYEVFILSRIREEYDLTGNTDLAVVRALGRTGRLVTSAALILFLAFLILGSAPDTVLKTFATALAAGILLDATVIRMLLVPALVSLFGRWNWWLPRVPAALMRTTPSHPRPERRLPVQPQEV